MAPKRPLDNDAIPTPRPKKQRSAFTVGPDNLPDGTYRRKAMKIKRDLIQKAKAKRSYAKLKAREPVAPSSAALFSTPSPVPEPATQELHPERQAMLDEPLDSALNSESVVKRYKKPAYFEKEQAYASQQRSAAEERRAEIGGRDKERKQKLAEREQFRRSMAKARSGGKNGQRKLGRESKVLLERVKRMVSD